MINWLSEWVLMTRALDTFARDITATDKALSTAIIAITTSSSMSVKAFFTIAESCRYARRLFESASNPPAPIRNSNALAGSGTALIGVAAMKFVAVGVFVVPLIWASI